MPKLSIITINLNNREGLQRTIQSVVSQTFTDFEYIIIDGGSTDGSVEVIREYVDRIDYWISEPDTGIYNAMNKGIRLAKGEYLLFLNSGDWLADENVVKDFYKSKLNEDVISGNVVMKNAKNEIWESPQKDKLVFYVFYRTTIPHQATFILKYLFLQYGFYNENNHIVSDWEFFLECLMINNCSYNHFDRIISYCDMTGISQNSSFATLQKEERQSILKKHFPSKILSDYDDLRDLKSITTYSLYPYVELFSRFPKLQRIVKRFMKIILILNGKKHLIPRQ
jgi:glycosyltransferase involved in cell wall biosynthesis